MSTWMIGPAGLMAFLLYYLLMAFAWQKLGLRWHGGIIRRKRPSSSPIREVSRKMPAEQIAFSPQAFGVTPHAERVLVIEDEPAMRTILRWNLQLAGYRVAEASDGVQAMNILRDEAPELALLDLSLPRMNGMVFLQKLAAMSPRPATRVIVMTAHQSTPLVVEAMRLGAADYLIKPIKPIELRTSIDTALGHRTAKITLDTKKTENRIM